MSDKNDGGSGCLLVVILVVLLFIWSAVDKLPKAPNSTPATTKEQP